MKEYILAANRIIVSPDEIRDPRALRLYHRLFKEGKADVLDPLLVVSPRLSCREAVEIEMREQFYSFLDAAEGDCTYLLDGHHRGLAGVLAGVNDYRVVEVEDDADVLEMRRRYRDGEVVSLPGCLEEEHQPQVSIVWQQRLGVMRTIVTDVEAGIIFRGGALKTLEEDAREFRGIEKPVVDIAYLVGK